jgi:hypothetical protein
VGEQPLKTVAWAAWPLGLLLIVAHTQTGILPLPAVVALDAAYVMALALGLRRARRQPLLAAGPVIFAVGMLTGVPSASSPPCLPSAPWPPAWPSP